MAISAHYDENGELTCVVFSECDEYADPELEITLAVEDVNPVQLAKWIRDGYDCTTPESLYIARCIARGETWRPPYDKFKYLRESPYCLVKVIQYNTTKLIGPAEVIKRIEDAGI